MIASSSPITKKTSRVSRSSIRSGLPTDDRRDLKDTQVGSPNRTCGQPEGLTSARCAFYVKRWGKKCHNLEVSAPYIDRMGDFVDVHPDQLLGRLTTGLAAEGLDTN